MSASPRRPHCYRSQCDDDGCNYTYIDSLSCDDPVNSNPLLTISPCLGNISWRTASLPRSISTSHLDHITKAQSHDAKDRRSTLGALSEMRPTMLRVTERLEELAPQASSIGSLSCSGVPTSLSYLCTTNDQ